MYELIYTSAPKGLIPGRSGFATVAMSEGMQPNLIVPLENLSGYNFTLRDGNFLPQLNPPCCYYIKMRYGNQQLHVAGRVAPNGLDYSKRNNKIAHHLLFESAEELENLSGGVAGLFLKDGVFRSEYTGAPAMLPFRKVPVCTNIASLPAKNWESLAGHASFAAYAAERFLENPDKPLYLIYPPDIATDKLLNLVMEVSALLNERLRNYFTFSTYFGSCAASVDCFLRMIPDFSPLVNNLRRFHKNDVIELGQHNELPQTGTHSAVYEYACTGKKSSLQQPPKQEAAFTQRTIRILADSGLPPQPIKDMLNDTPAINLPPQQPVNYRMFVLLGTAAVIIAAVLSLFLYDMPTKTEVPKQPEPQVRTAIKTPSATAPEQKSSPENPSQEQPSVSQPGRSNTNNPLPVVFPETNSLPSEKVQDKTNAENLFTDITLRSNAKMLPTQSALELFINFYREIISAQNTRLRLPAVLHGSSELYLKMERIGTSKINSSNFVCRGSTPAEVFVRAAQTGSLPLKPLAGEITDISGLMLKISADKKSLQIENYTNDQSNCIMPQPKHIKQIYFRKQNTVYVWENKFSKQYIDMIEPGKLILSPTSYTPAELEKSLSDCRLIETKFGECSSATFLGSSFNFSGWNQSVEEYKSAFQQASQWQKEFQTLIKDNSPPRSSKMIQDLLNGLDKLASGGDADTFTTEYSKFIRSLFNPAEERLITHDELRRQTEILCSILKLQLLDKKRREALDKQRKKWLNEVDLFKKFQDLQKNVADNNRNLEKVRERLKISAQSIITKAAQVHIDIEKLLLNMMTEANKSNWQIYPDSITPAEIEILSRNIIGKITFEPVAHAYGE